MKKNDRGFKIYTEFKDTYGHKIRVQQSSSACADRVWIFAEPNEDASERSPSPHLSRQQARWLGKALIKFADGK